MICQTSLGALFHGEFTERRLDRISKFLFAVITVRVVKTIVDAY